jgi:phage repressor protein C with HTH and peptisase S24 domain
LNNFVNSIAEDLVRNIDNVYHFINEYRYRTIVPNEEKRRAMLPHVNVPTKFDIANTTILMQELQGAPVIPTALCREGGCDILEYIEENPEEVEISPIRAKGVTIDLWYRIRASDNSNSPTYMPGDNIALASYPKGEERPRPGRFYVVDTYSNGFELGILYPTDGGDFRMQKKNRDEYPDFIIERDDIIRIYRVIMMVRI